MVASTRNTPSEVQALEHILHEIFGKEKDSTFAEVLKAQGINNANELLIADSDILSQEVTVDDGVGNDVQVTLAKLDIRKLDLLKEWYIAQDVQEMAT